MSAGLHGDTVLRTTGMPADLPSAAPRVAPCSTCCSLSAACASSLPARTRLFKGVLGLGPRLSLISVHPNGRQLGAIARLLGSGTLRPPLVSATFPLEQAGEAHAFLEGERGPRPPGKVVLQVAPPVLAEKDG